MNFVRTSLNFDMVQKEHSQKYCNC